ncbi:MAG: PAS domain-containing sensor histidine kinase [Proteobacteria bacterium]|nr:PAS domain-containing sensor histidine kinase [Pseudomonadota bacterium]MBU1060780.1 PAS domain-containing sensor histidine kinase [Pseudomonadota bacterium]
MGDRKDITKEQLYDVLLTNLPAGLFMVDAEFKIIEFNREAERLTGWQRAEVLGKQCSEILQSSLCETRCPIRQSVQEKRSLEQQETTLITKWNEKVPIFFSSAASVAEDGKMLTGVKIFRDATERKKLESQKKNVISIFAHDLKAPVSISGGFLNRLLQGKAGELTEKQKAYLLLIKKEIDRLEKYILHFLDVSRLESGQLQLSYETCNPDEILQELVSGFQIKAHLKKISIQYTADTQITSIVADKLQLERAVSNLLDNAIKYSPANSEVEINLKIIGDFILITVNDQGQGIAEDKLPYIFDYFFCLHEADKQTDGVGLGLAAVKGIVEAHGGTIWAESIQGKGSIFYIKIPRSQHKHL